MALNVILFLCYLFLHVKVRAATAYALGTFIHSGGKTERNELANKIDHAVALQLVNGVNSEASPLVRKEVWYLLFALGI